MDQILKSGAVHQIVDEVVERGIVELRGGRKRVEPLMKDPKFVWEHRAGLPADCRGKKAAEALQA